MTTDAMLAEAPQLRPLGVGDIIDRVFRMYRQRPALFLTLSAIPNLIAVLISQGARLLWPNAFVNFDEFTFLNDPNELFRVFQTQTAGRSGDLVVGLISVIPQSLGIAALTYAAANMHLGRPVAIGAALRAALVDVPRLIVTLLVVLIAFLLIYFLGVALSALTVSIAGIFVVLVFVVVIA